MDASNIAAATIPIAITISSIIFASGVFYGQSKKNATEIENLNDKLDRLTEIVLELQLNFAEFKGRYSSFAFKPGISKLEHREPNA